jgi:hypothetical protein
MTYPKAIFSVKNFLLAAVACLLLSNCKDQDMVAVSENAEQTKITVQGPNALSLTISGENTNFVGSVDCTTCTYVVPANAKVVDGKELGFKPGSVICLDAALQYGNIDFINLEGTTDKQITIGNCNTATAGK